MKYNKYVKYWLIAGCVLLFFQIFIGGVTRITGSGLSITKWEIVTGTLPPFTESSWNVEFDLYKETPQYKKINQGMTMSKFKFIYFWEFFHRFWARMMGFVFIFPFFFFVAKNWLDRWMIRQLGFVIFWALMAAVFGWIMVASGLVDRPWVNAYKLSLHLGIALTTLSFLLWGTYKAFSVNEVAVSNKKIYRLALFFLIALILQIFFGAIVSGMRAALYYPSWPDLNGQYIPEVLLDSKSWKLENLIDYDKDAFMPALIHVLHRNWGYLVYILGIYLSVKILRYPLRRLFYRFNIALILFLNLQVLLGILTLLNAKATIPIFYGIMHQAVAIFILCIALFNVYAFKKEKLYKVNLELIKEGPFTYQESNGGSEILLLLHGLFGATGNFKSIQKKFSDSYNVVTPILPIMSLPLKDLGLKSLVRHVEEFIDYKKFDKVHIIGNSLGGHIAQLFTLANPSKVLSLTLTGSSGLFENAMGSSFPKRGDYDFIKRKAESTFYDPKTATKEIVDEVFETVNNRSKAIRVVVTAKSAVRNNIESRIGKILSPVLLVWGKQDIITPEWVAKKFHEILPNSELELIDKCGHAPMMERPTEFNAILEKFLAKYKLA